MVKAAASWNMKEKLYEIYRGVVESAGGIFGGIPATAQRDHQQAGRAEQFGKDPERER